MLSVKVCGMRDKENIISLSTLKPDFIGFIFYPASKRYVGDLDDEYLNSVSESTKKVGVFVNSTKEEILEKVNKYRLDFVQLHGDEKPELCRELYEEGVQIIKAFSVDESFDFKILEDYKNYVRYFLFDTKGKEYGGNGLTFDWKILKKYHLEIPFFLSGGIDIQHIEKINHIDHKGFYAIDLNSRFEVEPGLKDIDKLKAFTEKLRNH